MRSTPSLGGQAKGSGEEEGLRPPEAQLGDHPVPPCQDLPERSVEEVRPPHQLLELPPPDCPLGERLLLVDALDDDDWLENDLRSRKPRGLRHGEASERGACRPRPGLLPSP